LQLCALNPAYIDLESHVPADFAHALTRRYPQIKLIISYHDFTKTPRDIDQVFRAMRNPAAHLYKLAFLAQSTLVAFLLLLFLKEKGQNIIVSSMGEEGAVCRILGPIFGNPITYASLDISLSTAPGQLSAQTLIESYHARSLSSQTFVYGLIGYPL